jgi:hypothetical protein
MVKLLRYSYIKRKREKRFVFLPANLAGGLEGGVGGRHTTTWHQIKWREKGEADGQVRRHFSGHVTPYNQHQKPYIFLLLTPSTFSVQLDDYFVLSFSILVQDVVMSFLYLCNTVSVGILPHIFRIVWGVLSLWGDDPCSTTITRLANNDLNSSINNLKYYTMK